MNATSLLGNDAIVVDDAQEERTTAGATIVLPAEPQEMEVTFEITLKIRVSEAREAPLYYRENGHAREIGTGLPRFNSQAVAVRRV